MILYNLRTDGDNWRITKFEDGNPTSSYLISQNACQCPAGERPVCRHRQMLPDLLDRHMADSGLFWHFDGRFSCDINGVPARHTVEQTVEPAPIPSGHVRITVAGQSTANYSQTFVLIEPAPALTPQPFRRRL